MSILLGGNLCTYTNSEQGEGAVSLHLQVRLPMLLLAMLLLLCTVSCLISSIASGSIASLAGYAGHRPFFLQMEIDRDLAREFARWLP